MEKERIFAGLMGVVVVVFAITLAAWAPCAPMVEECGEDPGEIPGVRVDRASYETV